MKNPISNNALEDMEKALGTKGKKKGTPQLTDSISDRLVGNKVA